MNKFLIIAAAIILTLTVFYATRFTNLNETPSDADTFSWLYRINYYPWIVSSNLKGIDLGHRDLEYAGKVSYHPGVTIMTFSGISTKIGKANIVKTDSNYETCAYADYSCKYLGYELFIAKLPLIIISGLLFGLCIFFLSSVFSIKHILVWILIVLFEPLLVQSSKLLHLDFLFGMFSIAALSALLFSAKNNLKWIMFVAGALMGFALLTRFTGSFMIPGVLATLFYLDSKNFIKNSVLFALGGIVSFIGFYPPMWVAPIETLTYIIESSIGISDNLAETIPAHIRYLNNLGWYFSNYASALSVYAIAAIFVGLAALVFAPSKNKNYAYAFLIIFLTYFSFVNLADKQYVRYLVPVLIGIAPAASFGIHNLICMIIKRIRIT